MGRSKPIPNNRSIITNDSITSPLITTISITTTSLRRNEQPLVQGKVEGERYVRKIDRINIAYVHVECNIFGLLINVAEAVSFRMVMLRRSNPINSSKTGSPVRPSRCF